MSLFLNNYQVHSTTSVGTTMFESKVEFKEVRASMAGQYTCVAWIGEEIYRNISDHANVTVKCKNKTNVLCICLYIFIIKCIIVPFNSS